jgi:hypothetical protein
VENQEDWLVLLRTYSILDILLVLAKKLRVKLNITWLVDTMNVTETSSNGEIRRDWRKGFVDSENVLRLSVERVVINILVVDTVLLTSSNSDFLDNILSQWK